MMNRLRCTLVVLVALAAASCSSGNDDGQTAAVLHRSISSDPETLDPQKARSAQAGDVLRDIGEGLLGYTATGELAAGAADSWRVSDDGLTYTFTIRDGARWSNGDALTAAHFAYSLRRLIDPETGALYAELVADIGNARAILAGDKPVDALGVEAVDDRTLVIRLEQPTPYLLNLLTAPATFPVHPELVEQHGNVFARPGTLVSNGAYKLKAWRPGSAVELVRNELYRENDVTSIDTVVYHVLTQEMTELNRYRAGEIHITENVPPDSFEQVREELGDQLRVAPKLGVYYYGFNLEKPPFAGQPGIREALSMAIDREVLVGSITGRGELPAYSWVPPGVDNYESTRFSFADMSQNERNALARRMLREAGYGPDNPLRFELRYSTSDTHRRIALAAQAMWREALGVEVTLVNEEFQVLLSNVREAEITQLFRMAWLGDYNDAHTFLSVLQAGNAANFPRYESNEYESLMRRAAAQADPLRRRLFLEEAERILLADHAVMPLYFYVSKHLVSPQVSGWGDNVLDYHYSRHLSLATR